jgi:predicted amidophosphoribosyltransferase
MVYCSRCGRELPEEANFCPKCGARTKKGIEEGIYIPREELREGLATIGVEIEAALTEAGREVQKALGEARESMKEAAGRKTIVCPRCGERNRSAARFCYSCGESLERPS